MATITIRQAYVGQPAQAVAVLREHASPLLAEHGIKWEWEHHSANICGKGVKGHCQVNPDEIEVELRLGLLLSAFSHRIEQEIAKALQQVPAKLALV